MQEIVFKRIPITWGRTGLVLMREREKEKEKHQIKPTCQNKPKSLLSHLGLKSREGKKAGKVPTPFSGTNADSYVLQMTIFCSFQCITRPIVQVCPYVPSCLYWTLCSFSFRSMNDIIGSTVILPRFYWQIKHTGMSIDHLLNSKRTGGRGESFWSMVFSSFGKV